MSQPGIIEHTLSAIGEIYKLMPDSLLFGTLLLYFFTQNLSYGVLAIFIFETVIGHRLVSWIVAQSVGVSRPTGIQNAAEKVKCRSGFLSPEYAAGRILNHEPYPSYGLFSISALASYFSLGMHDFTPTLTSMESSWSSRHYVAYGFIAFLLFAVILMRAVSGCEGTGEIVMALAMGVLFGWLGYLLNKTLFGVDAMNFLGLPYMESRNEKGDPIYICTQVQS